MQINFTHQNYWVWKDYLEGGPREFTKNEKMEK
jgi:hypothetical protein